MKDARAFRNSPRHRSLLPGLAIVSAALARAEPGECDDEIDAIDSQRTRALTAENETLRRELEKSAHTIRELRASEAEARKLSLAKSEVLASLSHEFRAPMSAIIAMMDLALEGQGPGGQVREYLQLARDSGASLVAMIDHILDFSRLEVGHLAIERVPFSLRETVGESLKPLAFEARRKQLAFSCDIAPGVGDAFVGDPMRLRQVLANVVGNAIKFTERGAVAVRIERAGGDADATLCRFSVADTGVGIARARQVAIFAPFEQAAPSTSRVYGGSGLGLTISARLVEMMDGSIRVESEPGRGTTFFFEIPLAHQRSRDAAAPCDPEPEVRAVQAHRSCLDVLLVDDNATGRRVAQAVLEHAGHRVEVAESGMVALRKLRRHQPDVVLTDLQMPRMGGLALARAIRKAERATDKRVPVIALTAVACRDEEARCLDAGMDGCMTKPVDPDRLLQMLARIEVACQHNPLADAAVLDRDALLERVGGDAELLGEITERFLDEHARLMNSARRAMTNRDTERFNYAMHTLGGMFRTLAAGAAQAMAGRVESYSLCGELGRVRGGFALLEKAVHTLRDELVAFAGAALKSRPPVSGCMVRPLAQRGVHEQRYSHR